MKYSDEIDMQNFKKIDTSSWDTLKDNVYVRLINRKYINKYDENIVHEPFMDLALTFSIQEKNKDIVMSHLLTKEDLKNLNVSTEEVKNVALHNTTYDRKKRVMTFKENTFKNNPMYPVLSVPQNMHMGVNTNRSSDFAMIQDVDSETGEENILMLGNKADIFGASYIASKEILEEIYHRFDENFYIIPLSVHQVMCVRTSYASQNGEKPSYEVDEDLLDMIESFNDDNNKSWKDILSYKIYYYLGDDGKRLFVIQ